MKKLFFMGFALLLCAMWPADAAAQLKIGGRKLNTGKLLEAGKDVAKAVTLSDKDIAQLAAKRSNGWMPTTPSPTKRPNTAHVSSG